MPETIAHTGFSSVAENVCENCHRPHGAGNQLRLTKYFLEEDNCLNCHNGNVAATDIQTDINLTSHHDVFTPTNIHDPVEILPIQTRHAECVDCHNPHFANNSVASAPLANGFIQGVSGITTDGNSVLSIQYEYELCYKCHADSPGKPSFAITRQYPQNNVRFQFDPGSISFHPVETAGKNTNVPSLIPGYTTSSIIYCTDCHASADAVPSAASGPHGSSHFPLLKYNYETASYTTESYSAYELCYQCHDYDKIINDPSNFGVNIHHTHIVTAQVISPIVRHINLWWIKTFQDCVLTATRRLPCSREKTPRCMDLFKRMKNATSVTMPTFQTISIY